MRHILVYAFEDAPEWCQKLSPHGGDEDWLAIVPRYFVGTGDVQDMVPWLCEGTAFGVCSVAVHELDDCFVVIGCHA